ncbi:MAG: YbhB/YbcL family Raf kinase inhibitor-like protein [Chloroflexi bacterium]|nr:YbhB/YbcL family Raf kinase inhibitor-like protein [Chloroflexota bacterium]
MLLTVLVTLLAACGGKGDGTTLEEESTVPVIAITSPAFLSGEPIPAKYAKGRETLSPPLEWGQPPEGTQSLALICDDPDAPGGTWVHWVIYNLPPTTRSLPEGVSRDVDLADGSHNGKNSWGNIGYDGPSPPGGTHRYYFKLYAIDTMLDLDSGATKKEVLEAIEGHLLARGELMGTYKK